MIELHEHDYYTLKRLNAQLKPTPTESSELQNVLAQALEQFPVGCSVIVNHTDYTGSVISYNDTLGGFYPGVRYPVHVKIEEAGDDPNKVVGLVFEYGLNQLTKIEKQHD